VREEMQTILTLLGVGTVRGLGPEFLQKVQP
jgi:hypothetical protein